MKKEIPAFPLARYDSILPDNHGMSLRDYFAAAAMSGMCGSLKYQPTSDPATIVESAFIIADAMLEAREK